MGAPRAGVDSVQLPVLSSQQSLGHTGCPQVLAEQNSAVTVPLAWRLPQRCCSLRLKARLNRSEAPRLLQTPYQTRPRHVHVHVVRSCGPHGNLVSEITVAM